MTIKIGINGMGRIGRMIVRSIIETQNRNLKIQHINNRSNAEVTCKLLKYDSIHGKFNAELKFDENELIITEKSGKIKIVNIKSNKISEVDHNLNFLEYGQGGLLDILFKDNFVYISYSENRGNWKSSTSIAKAKFDKIKLNFKNIFRLNLQLTQVIILVQD